MLKEVSLQQFRGHLWRSLEFTLFAEAIVNCSAAFLLKLRSPALFPCLAFPYYAQAAVKSTGKSGGHERGFPWLLQLLHSQHLRWLSPLKPAFEQSVGKVHKWLVYQIHSLASPCFCTLFIAHCLHNAMKPSLHSLYFFKQPWPNTWQSSLSLFL